MTKKKAKSNIRNDIKGIILITIGILILFSIFAVESSGYIGKIIRKLFLALFGIGLYIIPLIIIFIGICYIIKTNRIKYNKRFVGILILIIDTMLFVQMAYINNYFINNEFLSGILLIYDSSSVIHGGILSYLLVVPLYKLFGNIGSYVILSSLFIVSIILIFQISLQDAYNKMRKDIKTSVKKKNKQTSEKNPNILVDDNEHEDNKANFMNDLSKKMKIIEFMKSNGNIESVDAIDDVALEQYSNIDLENVQIEIHKSNDNSFQKESISPIEENELISNNIESDLLVEYKKPSVSLLNINKFLKMNKDDKRELLKSANKLTNTLSSFGVNAKVTQVTKGPSVTRFELQPQAGVKVSKIVNLSDDIALSLAASGVRIEAPIPGKSAVGIEVPNSNLMPVYLREVIESDEYNDSKKNIVFCLGKDIAGNCFVSDITKMPHVLIAGATGSGKSVCINSLILGILFKYSPEDVKLLMIDPKVVELNVYNGIPHLLIPVVTEPKKAAGALNWAVSEMTRRYKLFADNNVRNIEGYNDLANRGKVESKLPWIIIIIDELADLMMVCPNDIEDYIGRLAQMARAAGMHLVIATQRPSVDVITGVIKANIPSRISFAVSSQIDSRTILDTAGAEKLLGKGDMLFYPVGASKPLRIQGAFISEEEVEKVVSYIKDTQDEPEYKEEILEEINTSVKAEKSDSDDLLDEAVEIVLNAGQASASLLQRRLRIGYNRAARIIEELEEREIISSRDGSKPRQVLISKEQYRNDY